MPNSSNSDNLLSVLAALMPPPADDIARTLATDFRRRRIEKSLTRRDISQKSGVPLANIARFEQKGLISLNNFIELAICMGYVAEVKDIFSQPKYDTMEELLQIRKNRTKKKAYKHKPRLDSEKD